MVRVYKSTDPGAPVLSGTAGSLLAVLDACLVNGYGTLPGAGWEKSFTGVNTAAYRPPEGNRFYLRVDDADTRYPKLRGYRTMSDVDTGDLAFPTVAQLADGIRTVKSNSISADPRAWIIIASARSFYYWVKYTRVEHTILDFNIDIFFFGDIVTYLPADNCGTMLIGKIVADITATSTILFSKLVSEGTSAGHYIAGGYQQGTAAELCGLLRNGMANAPSTGSSGSPFPDPIMGGLMLDRVMVMEGLTADHLIRGNMPGAYNPIHNRPGIHLQFFEGRGNSQGVDVILLDKGGNSNYTIGFSLSEDDWYPW